MSMVFALLMLLGGQNAPAAAANWQDGVFTHGVWKGQCWLTGIKSGPVCRAAAGQAGKMWIMIERHPDRLDIYASGACTVGDTDPASLPQTSLTRPNRVDMLRALIDLLVQKTNLTCKTQEAFPITAKDTAALLTATDVVSGAKQ